MWEAYQCKYRATAGDHNGPSPYGSDLWLLARIHAKQPASTYYIYICMYLYVSKIVHILYHFLYLLVFALARFLLMDTLFNCRSVSEGLRWLRPARRMPRSLRYKARDSQQWKVSCELSVSDFFLASRNEIRTWTEITDRRLDDASRWVSHDIAFFKTMLLFSHDSRSLLISFDLLASAGGIKSSSVCVRNVAFEATSTSFQFQAQVIGLNQIHCFHIHFRLPLKIFWPWPRVFQGKELLQLFGAYGTVTSCRLPKKADYSGHRGLAFKHWNQQTEHGKTPGTPYVLALRVYIMIQQAMQMPAEYRVWTKRMKVAWGSYINLNRNRKDYFIMCCTIVQPIP